MDPEAVDGPDWRSRLIAFYSVYNPTKLIDVSTLLETYKDRVRTHGHARGVARDGARSNRVSSLGRFSRGTPGLAPRSLRRVHVCLQSHLLCSH